MPVLSKKGDSKIAFNYSSNIGSRNSEGSRVSINGASGMDLQVAYAISNKWALQVSWYSRREKNDGDYSSRNLDSTVIRYKRHMLEGGIGYYKPLDINGKMIFQLFAGFGLGHFNFTDNGVDASQSPYDRFHKAEVTKWYIQPAIMLRSKPNLFTALSSRVSLLDFNHIQSNYNSSELNNYKLDSIGLRPVGFWEPAFVNTIGFKKIPGLRLEYQLGLCILMSKHFVDSRPFNFSAGLLFDLPVFLNKKTNDKK